MKTFPLKFFIMVEASAFIVAMHEYLLLDKFGMFVLFQIPVFSMTALVWMTKLGWFN